MVFQKARTNRKPFGFVGAVLFVVAVFLSGCMVGPDFKRPIEPSVKTYKAAGQNQNGSLNASTQQKLILGKDIPGQWWAVFRSPQLSRLIEQAIKHNPNLQAAQAALTEAQENALTQRGFLFPSVEASFNDTRQQVSGAMFGNPSFKGSLFNLYNASVNVSYTLDVFGGIRRQIEGAKAQTEYQRFLLEGVFLTLAANVVTTAIEEASIREQITLTEDIIRTLQKQLTITQQQFDLGANSKGPVLAQQTELTQLRASLPTLQQQLAVARHRLSVLVGDLPTHELDSQFQLADLTLPDDVPLSLPSKLVEQRPDIRAQEAVLHAASAQIGVVQAGIFPDFTISANVGTIATHIGDLFMPGSLIWSTGLNLLQPVFKGGAFIHNKRAALASYQEAAGVYKNTVLQSFQNVVDVLSALENDAAQLQAQNDAAQVALENVELNRQQFQLGAVSYLPLLDAERSYQQIRVGQIKAQAMRLADTAALFQSLGGGWWNRPEISAPNKPVKKTKSAMPWLDPIKETLQEIQK
jgi:NodT family efflux transporter outer membrane factor (OMF) lipoprotein